MVTVRRDLLAVLEQRLASSACILPELPVIILLRAGDKRQSPKSEEVDFDRGFVRVRKQLDWTGDRFQPKTEEACVNVCVVATACASSDEGRDDCRNQRRLE